MRAGFGVDTVCGQAQALDRASGNEVFGDDFGRILRLHFAVPDRLRIHHHDRTVFALVEAERLVDADDGAEASRAGELLQLGDQLALAVRCAGDAGRSLGADVLADENMAFK